MGPFKKAVLNLVLIKSGLMPGRWTDEQSAQECVTVCVCQRAALRQTGNVSSLFSCLASSAFPGTVEGSEDKNCFRLLLKNTAARVDNSAFWVVLSASARPNTMEMDGRRPCLSG